MNYYYSCIEQIIQKINKPKFFVFSDEPEWAYENLKVNYPIVSIDCNRKEYAYEDLRLMSQCKHHIIANSSFSWWGAWLNPNPDKIVFSPRKRFRTKELDDRDLIPINWFRI